MQLIKECIAHPVFEIIAGVVADEKMEAYVVGGYVRDYIMNRESNDIDIVVVGSGIALAEKVAAKLGEDVHVSVFKNFGTAMLMYGNMNIEFVGARKESYDRNSRKPVVEDGTLEDDQKRRDFNMNALAVSLSPSDYGAFIDPFGGVRDIDNRIIRTPQDAEITFSDDPLRMIRAIRFASQLGFVIEEKTYNAIISRKERLRIVSHERISDELHKIMMSKKPSVGFMLLSETGLLDMIIPELELLKGVEKVQGMHHKDNFLHTMQVLDNVSIYSGKLWLRWAALLHDIGKPRTKNYDASTGWTFHGHDGMGAAMIPGIFKRIRMPLNDKMKYVQKLVALHLRPIALAQEIVTDSAVRRLLFEAGDDVDDLMLLCEADITSKNEKRVREYLRNFGLVREKLVEIEKKDAIRNFQPPIDGNKIVEIFGIPPGRRVGILKNAIKDAILDGVIPNEYDAAYKFLLEKGKELNLL